MAFDVFLISCNPSDSAEVTETNPFTGASITRTRRTLSPEQISSVSALLVEAGWNPNLEEILFEDGGRISASFANLQDDDGAGCEGGAISVHTLSEAAAQFVWAIADLGCMYLAPAMPGNPLLIPGTLENEAESAGLRSEVSVCATPEDLLRILSLGFETHRKYVDQVSGNS